MQTPPQAGRYKTLVVDPPWSQGKTNRRSVRPNQTTTLDYPTMMLSEIAELPVTEWSDPNSALFLWTTNSRDISGKPLIPAAFDLMEGWGFRYYTLLTWSKPTGPCPFGPWQITTEHVLVGFRGKFPFVGPKGKLQTCFAAPVRKPHSTKPLEFYDSVLTITKSPRLDVFARKPHDGFDGWGLDYEGGF